MNRRESDREDLLREATALVERAELQVPGFAEPVVVGFRPDGAASFFFGADAVYQFNAARELRRAFVDGLLFKAERGKLVELRRERSEGAVALVRRELDAENKVAFMVAVHHQLARLRAECSAKSLVAVGQVPVEGKVLPRIIEWLAELPRPIMIADIPNVAR